MSWPPYWLIAAASAAGSSLIAELVAGGNTIFWAASWLCTSLLTTECPQSSSPPPIARTTASTRPAIVASASNVLLRISIASSHWAGLIGPGCKLPSCPQRQAGPGLGSRAAGHGSFGLPAQLSGVLGRPERAGGA